MPGTPTKSSTQSASKPAMDPKLLADAVAAAVSAALANLQPAAAPRPYPVIPKFVPDPAKPNAASRWFTQVESIFRLQTLTDAEKCSLVSGALDPVIFDRVADALLPDAIDTIDDYAKLKGKVTGLFDYSVSLFAERYSALFDEWKGPEHESVPELLARIQRASKCMDSITLAEIQTLMLMAWMKSPSLEKLRTHVLDKLNAKHDTTLDECGKSMIAKLQTQRDQSLPMKTHINFVQKKKVKVSYSKKEEDKKPSQRSSPASCGSCGGTHDRNTCKFKDAQCRYCKIKGHIESACRKKKTASSNSKPNKNVRSVRVQDPIPQVSSYHIQHVSLDIPAADRRHMVDISIDDITLSAQMDDGADISIMSHADYTKLGSPTYTGSGICARGAFGQEEKLLGSFKAKVGLKGKTKFVQFQVAKIPSTLLGTDFFTAFDINLTMDGEVLCNKIVDNSVTPAPIIDALMKKYEKVFEPGLGCCTKLQIKLQLKKDANPVYIPARRSSLHASEHIKNEFNRLSNEDIVEKVGFSEWAAPCSIVPRKDGRPRLVVDYSTGLNDRLEEPCYTLPLPEDIFARLNGCSVFSVLDFSDAYHQLELDEESRGLTTVSTNYGLYRYKRLGFGVKTAVSDFQEVMDRMFDGSPGNPYLDDVVVGSRNFKEHVKHLERVLALIMEWGFKLNPKKCKFFQKSIRFLGKVIDASGIHPDPEKIAAIQKMAVPTDLKSLRSFLGLANYYQSFIPAFREIREPLDDLLKNDAKWKWDAREQAAFDQIKNKLSNECLLTHYDPRLPITVAADASENGMGGVISHVYPDGSEKPIQFFSRSLNQIQRKYSQTEKEGLALVTAIKTFNRYLEGRKFTLFTDHKALLAIFDTKKPKPILAANRLYRWALFLSGYNFDIKYTRTTAFGQADALSRLISETKSIPELFEEEEDMEEAECSATLVNQISAFPVTAVDIVQGYEDDEFAKDLLKSLQNGTADSRFSLVNDVILMNDRVYVPPLLRLRVLDQLHTGHSGISLTKQLARQHVYWPNITKDIESMIKHCPACIQLTKSPVKATLASWNKSMNPGDRIHIDFAGPILDHMLLVIVDSCSKWLDVKVLRTASTKTTVEALTGYIADNGIPRVLVSDNGVQFTSDEFAAFCKHHGIKHMRSPVYTPQSNGQAERMVDVVKRFVKKNILKLGPNMSLKRCINEFLLVNRSTPSTATPGNVSPAMAHLGREIRTHLSLLQPQLEKNYAPDLRMEEQFNKQYGARLRKFQVNDEVWARKRKETPWFEGRVTGRRGSRIYEITEPNGLIHRLHSNQLIKRDPVALFNDMAEDEPSSAPPPTVPSPSPITSQPSTRSPSPAPSHHSTASTQSSAPTSPIRHAAEPSSSPPQPLQLRRSERTRKAPTRLNVDPSKNSYY